MKVVIEQCENTGKYYIRETKDLGSKILKLPSHYIDKKHLFKTRHISTWSLDDYVIEYCTFDTEEEVEQAIEKLKEIMKSKLKLKKLRVVKIS